MQIAQLQVRWEMLNASERVIYDPRTEEPTLFGTRPEKKSDERVGMVEKTMEINLIDLMFFDVILQLFRST